MRAPQLSAALRASGVALCVVTATLVGSPAITDASATTGDPVTAISWNSLPSLAQVQSQLAASSSITALPTPTNPPIGDAWEGPNLPEINGQKGCGQIDGDTTDITSETACVFGDVSSSRTIVVVGDSMADMWIPMFDLWGYHEHWKIYRLMKFGCEPWLDSPATTWAHCAAWKKFVVKKIDAIKPYAVVATGMETNPQTGWVTTKASEISSAILGFQHEIVPSHAKLFVLQNTPWLFSYTIPQQCLIAHANNIRVCNHDPQAKVLASAMSSGITEAASTKRLKEVPVLNLLCTATTCPILADGRIVMADNHHVCNAWAEYVAKAFSQDFNPLAPL